MRLLKLATVFGTWFFWWPDGNLPRPKRDVRTRGNRFENGRPLRVAADTLSSAQNRPKRRWRRRRRRRTQRLWANELKRQQCKWLTWAQRDSLRMSLSSGRTGLARSIRPEIRCRRHRRRRAIRRAARIRRSFGLPVVPQFRSRVFTPPTGPGEPR